MDLRLSGKRAFITGGSAGIGLAVAERLRSENAVVTICARDKDRLDSAITALGGSGKAWGIVADVTEPRSLGNAVNGAAERMGGIDLLVANAGGSVGGDLLDSTPEDWAATYALNVLHAAHAIRTAVPHLERAGGGAVVIIASITGWKAGPKSSYATAKAAEIHLGIVLAQELGQYRIRVNTVSPGSTYFPGGGWERLQEQRPEQFATFAHDEFPAGRLLRPDEIADTVCFLLSERASAINGAHIPADSGQGRPNVRTFGRDRDSDGPAT